MGLMMKEILISGQQINSETGHILTNMLIKSMHNPFLYFKQYPELLSVEVVGHETAGRLRRKATQ